MSRHPELHELLVASMHVACPMTVPVVVPRLADMSDEDYRVALGYKSDEDEGKYIERMTGIVTFYAAIVQVDSLPGMKNPVGIDVGWRWVARTLNMRPRKVTPSVLLAFLSVAGHSLHKTYKKQFAKLLQFVASDYSARMPDGCEGAVARLRVFLDGVFKSRSVPIPEGRELATS
ncbi:hypothetical protein CAOG_08555 [Capsaspora owczarzaki ATCC 30864]|uniref:mRNA export factor GLE1 n=1 Tax=Capsaspora owczarzaki (strain ATCC 30864) TaxID=595528 RepID=A0A0D2WLA2_CAPO3|nr:hypothetical protein CAOG_08555 [Capsaspora owczarzaki ATCC 30864]KJE90568.1 hypothetical protein CAOG_008555 [Capsaspora owczarzaki ATCC 30864]|eukprot:XP_011270137.1 hypothetical protein CAOG_08555 [Capsaspora owczarzaki ATCC 30864]